MLTICTDVAKYATIGSRRTAWPEIPVFRSPLISRRSSNLWLRAVGITECRKLFELDFAFSRMKKSAGQRSENVSPRVLGPAWTTSARAVWPTSILHGSPARGRNEDQAAQAPDSRNGRERSRRNLGLRRRGVSGAGDSACSSHRTEFRAPPHSSRDGRAAGRISAGVEGSLSW